MIPYYDYHVDSYRLLISSDDTNLNPLRDVKKWSKTVRRNQNENVSAKYSIEVYNIYGYAVTALLEN